MGNIPVRISRGEKAKILEELFTEGCEVSDLARKYGILPKRLYGWRSRYKEIYETKEKVPDSDFMNSESTSSFVEVSLDDAPPSAFLKKAELEFEDFTVSIIGKVTKHHLEKLILMGSS